MSTSGLTDEQVLRRALDICHGKQADVAAATHTAPSSVSRWLTGRSRPEVEAALRLAVLTQLPRAAVLRAFGYDPDELGIQDDVTDAPAEAARLKRTLRDVMRLVEPFTRSSPARSLAI